MLLNWGAITLVTYEHTVFHVCKAGLRLLTNNKTRLRSKAIGTTRRSLTLGSHPTAGRFVSCSVLCSPCTGFEAHLGRWTSCFEQAVCNREVWKGKFNFWLKCTAHLAVLQSRTLQKTLQKALSLFTKRLDPFLAAVSIHHSVGHRQAFLYVSLGVPPVAEKRLLRR